MGRDGNYQLQMRANLNSTPPVIEFRACFPENAWLGMGLGGNKMTQAELVFFMAPANLTMRNVVSTRMVGSMPTRPENIPMDSPIYERNISTCGDGLIEFVARRPLEAT